jgi:opacity protein-like surface antigen
VFRLKPILQALAFLLVLTLAATAAQAADVDKKWRLGVALGGFNSQDEIESASANELFTLNPCAESQTCEPGAELIVRAYRDPRNDSQVFGSLDINPALLGTLSVQYGLSKIFIIEGSVGYQKGDLGDVEVSAQLAGNPSEDPNIDFLFVTKRVPVGELEVVPIQVTAMARMRPRETFHPYFGAGMGYSIVGLDLDSEFQQLSANMDASRGRQLRLEPFFAISGPSSNTLNSDGLPQVDLQGATVDARDTFEWHLVGGAEVTIKKRWSAFVDVRWVDASKSVSIGFNGTDELGNSLPNFAPFDDSEIANQRYGPSDIGSCTKDPSGSLDQNGEPVNCTGGGLVDYGFTRVVPTVNAPSNIDCKNNGSDIASPFCTLDFVFQPDGVADPGAYYAPGGSIDYDGFSLQLGFRFTFGE